MRSIGLCMTLLFLSGCAVSLRRKGKEAPDNSATDRKRKLADDGKRGGRARDAATRTARRAQLRQAGPEGQVSDDDPSEIRGPRGSGEDGGIAGDRRLRCSARPGPRAPQLDEDDAKEKPKRSRSSRHPRLDVRFAAQAAVTRPNHEGRRATREASDDGLTAVKERCTPATRPPRRPCPPTRAAGPSSSGGLRALREEAARARKSTPRHSATSAATRKGSAHDHALEFALCEAEVTAKRLDHEDREPVERYERTTPPSAALRGAFAAPRLIGGASRFRARRVQETTRTPTCKEVPKKQARRPSGRIKDGSSSRPARSCHGGDFRVSETADGIVKKFATFATTARNKDPARECGESDPRSAARQQLEHRPPLQPGLPLQQGRRPPQGRPVADAKSC